MEKYVMPTLQIKDFILAHVVNNYDNVFTAICKSRFTQKILF